MCFRHFDRGSQTNFHLRYLTAGTELSTLGNTFSCLVNSRSVGARRAVFLLTLYSYYHGVYKNGMPMTESIQTYSSCTQFILKGLFFWKAKPGIQYDVVFFFHLVCKHICCGAGWGEGSSSNCCPGSINEFYFKKNWKPLECIRSFNLLYKMY